MLCFGAFDWTLRSPHPYSFTVHHVIPVGKGGDRNDLNNMEPAHKVCNERQGVKPMVPEQVPMPRSEDWP